jgi:hypothetical protein
MPACRSPERQGGAPQLGERPAPVDAHVHVDAARARRLGPAHEPEVGENLPHDARHVLELGPRHARRGVEVDAELVGVLEVLRPE